MDMRKKNQTKAGTILNFGSVFFHTNKYYLLKALSVDLSACTSVNLELS